MMIRCTVFLCALCFAFTSSFAQTPVAQTPVTQLSSVQQPVQPPSSLYSVPAATSITLPLFDNSVFIAEDQAEYEAARLTGDLPPARISRPQEVNLNLNNSGTWETLPGGDRIWRLRIQSQGATDLFIQYDQWRIVKPCELYLYNDDHSMVLGPYTSIDNWDGTNITPITKGDAITLEYWVPADQEDIGELSIVRVLHCYTHFNDPEAREQDDALDNFGDSMPCMININCFPYMQEEKRAVAMIIDPMGGACSGTMLNNTVQNGDPLFLTANHCLTGNQSNWLFYFNYESPNCSPNQNGSGQFVVSNATLLMNHAPTDHALLRLSRTRPDAPFIPAFMGWYRADVAATSSYGIHHPAADVKKGHEDYQAATSTDWNGAGPNTHWLTHIDNGMMEPGSSGSCMINPGGYVVGPLHGGSWDCDPNTVNDAKYGKMSGAWEGGGGSSSRLRDWLDPSGSGATWGNYWQPQGPPNDNCNDPGVPVITGLPYHTTGSTQFAVNNFNSTGGCHTNTSPEVIWFLNLACDHSITVSSCGSSFDTQIFVYQVGTCLDVYSMPGCDDDFCGLQSQVTFNLWGGYRYMIVLEGYGSAAGNYVLDITGNATGAQGNAQCPGYTIDTVPYFTYGANYCGGDNVNPSCQSNDGEDVHWNWTSPYSQAMRARTCYINFDTILEVREGGACPGTWLTGCNDDYFCGSNSYASTVVFDAYVGGVYYIHMDGWHGAEGIASLELDAWNDDCSSPWIINNPLPFNTGGDTRPARDDFATVGYLTASSKDLFFQYTSNACKNMGVEMCFDTQYDSYVEVRTGGPCPGSTVVTYNDDYCGLASQATWRADSARTYYIIVGGYADAAGPFSIHLYDIPGEPVPAIPPRVGDTCPGITIPSVPFTDYGNTCCMADNYEPCGYSTSPEVVYNLYLTQCRTVTVSTCGSAFDTKLAVYNGDCNINWPLVGCNDDNWACGDYSLQSSITFQAEAYTPYQILLHGYYTYCGYYVLNVTDAPCPVGPVDSLVIRAAYPALGDITLTWTPAAYAVSYNVYGSPDINNIVQPANLFYNTAATSATFTGLSIGNEKLYFQVEAVGQASLLAEPMPEYPKEMGVQTAPVENPNMNAVSERNVEQAPLNGK